MKATLDHQKSHTTNSKQHAPFFSPAVIQPALTINEPGDQYEQEADQMADHVMRMESAPGAAPMDEDDQPVQRMPLAISRLQRKCTACEGEEYEHIQQMPLMRKSTGGGYTASSQLTSQLSQSKGGGSSLPTLTRSYMSKAFGTDFSQVRVHTSSQANEMSQGIQAKAFTHGSDIYFNKGQYSPESSDGKKLLAHELTHVVQQGSYIQKLQRTPGRQTTCNTPRLVWQGDPLIEVDNPVGVITAAENRAQEMLDFAIGELDFTRQEILSGAEPGWPTVSDTLGFAIRLLAGDPDSRVFWTRTGINTAHLLLRRLRAVRGTIGAGSFFFHCRGDASGNIGSCSGTICGVSGNDAIAASCDNAFTIHLCRPFWQETPEEQSATIIHESFHNFAAFVQDSGREGNAECYARFVQVVANAPEEAMRTDLCPDPI